MVFIFFSSGDESVRNLFSSLVSSLGNTLWMAGFLSVQTVLCGDRSAPAAWSPAV